jgi:PAS domain S-box-containing protein
MRNDRKTFLDFILTMTPEVSGEAWIIVSSKARIVFANQFAESMFGYEETEMQNMPLEGLMPKSIQTKHIESRNKYLKKPAKQAVGLTNDILGLHKNGRIFSISARLKPIHYNDEVYIVSRIFKKEEVFKRHLIEEAYDFHTTSDEMQPFSNQQTISSMEKRLLDANSDGWWSLNLKTKAVCVSRKLKRALGYQDNVILDITSLISNSTLLKKIMSLDDEGHPIQEHEAILEYKQKGKKNKLMFSRFGIIKNKDGQPLGRLSVNTDLSNSLFVNKTARLFYDQDLILKSIREIILAPDSIEHVLMKTTRALLNYIEWPKAEVFFLDKTENKLQLVAKIERNVVVGFKETDSQIQQSNHQHQLAQQVIENKQISWIQEKDNCMSINNDSLNKRAVGIPLYVFNDVTYVLCLHSDLDNISHHTALKGLNYLSYFISTQLQEKKHQQVMTHLVNVDSMTGFKDGLQFISEAKKCIRQYKIKPVPFLIMKLSINDFFHFKQKYGEQYAAYYLSSLGMRFMKKWPKGIKLYRISDNEMGIVLKMSPSDIELKKMLKTIKEQVNSPINIFGHSFCSTVSIAVAEYPCFPDGSSHDYFSYLDLAFTYAKRKINSIFQCMAFKPSNRVFSVCKVVEIK